jgi:hypothetical protein
MSEVLSGINFSVGIVNIILSTIPTAVKVVHNHRDRPEIIRGLRARLVDCELQTNTLRARWQNLHPIISWKRSCIELSRHP